MMVSYAGYCFDEDSEHLDAIVDLHEQGKAAGMSDYEIAVSCCSYLRLAGVPKLEQLGVGETRH